MTAAWGCGRGLTSATPPPVAVTELSPQFQGFIGAGPGLLAAPDLVDVLGLIHGMGYRPNLDECARMPELRAQCWLDIKDPGDSLLIATVVDEPCLTAQSVSGALSSTELAITVVHTGVCGHGGASAGTPYLSLLAIPLTALPADEVTVKVFHTGLAVPMQKMMVDLRRPLTIGTDVQVQTNQIIAAVKAALNDAANRLGPGQAASFLAIGTDRWTDAGLGCPTSGHSYAPQDARGYVVFLKDPDLQQLPMQYHISGASLAFCGRTAY